MGEAAPPPGNYFPPGNDCSVCFPPGLTPRWFTLVFLGIEKCEDVACESAGEPMNGAFKCDQDPNRACLFNYPPGPIDCWLLLYVAGGGSMVALNKIDPVEEWHFGGMVGANCVTSFENINQCEGWPPACYNKGNCYAMPGAVDLDGWLQYSANFEPSADALHDTFEVEGSTDVVVRIVNPETSTNVKIKYRYP